MVLVASGLLAFVLCVSKSLVALWPGAWSRASLLKTISICCVVLQVVVPQV